MMCRIMQIEENVMPRWITACERHCPWWNIATSNAWVSWVPSMKLYTVKRHFKSELSCEKKAMNSPKTGNKNEHTYTFKGCPSSRSRTCTRKPAPCSKYGVDTWSMASFRYLYRQVMWVMASWTGTFWCHTVSLKPRNHNGVQFVMYITIKPHHPPIMGIQSLMGTSNSHLKCCNPNHLVTSLRMQLPLMQSEAPPLRWCDHGRVGLAGFLCRHSSRGSGHATFFVYIFLQGL